MFSYLLKFIRWLFEKFAAAALIVGLGVIACGLWLFLKDNIDFEQWRQDVVHTLNGKRAEFRAARDDVQKRMDRISAEISAEQARAKLADSAMGKLHELESTWDKYVGNPAQQKANAEQLGKLTETRRQITDRIAALQRDFTRATWERDGLEVALGRIDTQIAAAEAQRSRAMHYVQQAWEYPLGRGVVRLPVKWWVAIFLGFYFLGPTAGKMWMYYFVAPFIARGKGVRLEQSVTALPDVGESRVSAELILRPGERLWIKEKFLQASDEGVRKKTRSLLDWRIPFTCLATGLAELIELKNAATDPSAADQRATLSNQNDPHSELAVITLPAGATLVLRPSFLAGVAIGDDTRLQIRRRWQLFRWQAWVTLQFRFFEFAGPCRLIVAGSRGVRAERLVDRAGDAVPARRTNQDATIGFTPNLDYRPARAETFWSYYRGMNPLFDDLFVGRGIFLCQQVSAPGDAKRARKFWFGVWSGAMKVFGL
jgi:hypothetical protein